MFHFVQRRGDCFTMDLRDINHHGAAQISPESNRSNLNIPEALLGLF